jgi:serine/threonine-protein kinase
MDVLLGEGGLGQVYRGTHLRLGRPVAIKVMHAHHVTKGELRTRFDREARSLAALAHPNVVGVIDYGVDGDLPFLVMDFLEGRTLEAAIHDGIPSDRVVPIFRDVLRAVAYAHGVGLVHRDLKPANVFLHKVPEIGEVVRVLDFGLAKFIDGEGAGATVTRAGMVIGTPAYMSPEQATASIVDARADVYSLGVLLFEMITGQRPFTGDDGAEVLRKHLLQPLPDMRELAPRSPLVAQLAPIVKRATEKAKADRYSDASEMAAALDALVGRTSSPSMLAVVPQSIGAATKADSIHITISDVPISGAKSGAKSAAKSAAKTAEAKSSAKASAKASEGSPIPLLAAAGVLALLVIGGLAYFFGSHVPPPTSSPPSTVAIAEPPPTHVAAPPPPTSVAFVPPTTITPPPPPPTTTIATPPPTATPNPWASPLPPQLQPIAARLAEQREISRDQRDMLYRFSRNHPHDARGLLMLGRAEVIAHAYTDGCHRYQHAYDVDHDARFDPAMRHDLVVLVTQPTSSAEATRMVRAIYGLEALPEIASVQAEIARDVRAVARLEHLRTLVTTP